MELLFMLEPWVELGNPSFRYGALKNHVRRIASVFVERGHSATVIIGEGVEHALAAEGLALPGLRLVRISQRDLLRHAKSYAIAAAELHQGTLSFERLAAYGELFRQALGPAYRPDVIVSWEAPVPHLKRCFPDALVLHTMPGFMSRVPYPELLSIDPVGFFQNSLLATEAEFFKTRRPTGPESGFLRAIREHYLAGYFLDANPFPRSRLDPAARFKRLVLLPLQVSGYFAFDATSGYRHSLDLVLDVLNSVPPEVGVVVTQYVTPNTADCVLNPRVIEYLRGGYPNFLFDPEFNEVEGVSQYLLAAVDGVACVSSSIGFQALLWQKPVFAFGNSHLNAFSAGIEPEAIERALAGDGPDFDGALAFMLTRMQPLLLSRCYESDWLVGFTERALERHRRGLAGLDLFEPISPPEEYQGEFIEASKRTRARQRLNQAKLARTTASGDGRGLALKVVSGGHTAVTFDIFDTLICRPFARPVDLFAFMAPAVRDLTAGAIPDFMQLRIGAEAVCRDRVRQSDGGLKREITLDEIYDELVAQLALEPGLKSKLIQLELDTERRFLRARKLGAEAYQTAVASGAPVYLVSDMYLPRSFLEDVLRDLGFTGHVDLLVSSQVGVRKHEGHLFDELMKLSGLPPDALLHVGDNPHGDRDVPRSKKMRALLVPSAFHNLFAHPRWGKAFRAQRSQMTLPASMLLGVTANRLFDDPDGLGHSHFGGDLRALGYFGLGWMFVGMVQWLIQCAKRDGIEVLYFLSRDGEILRDVYRGLAPAYPELPEARYLLSSRRAAQVAGIFTREDVVQTAVNPFHQGTAREFLHKRFGLEAEHLHAYDEALLGAEVGGVAGQSARVRTALIVEREILAHAEEERSAYLCYLESEGLRNDDRRVGVVDIGYAGSMQRALLRMTGRSQLSGYYFMTFGSAQALVAEGQICRAYVSEFVEKSTCVHPFARHGLMFEVLLSNDQPSLARFKLDDHGAPKPLYQPAKHTPSMHRFQVEVRKGLADLLKDLVDAFGRDLSVLQIDADTALLPLSQLFDNPHQEDAAQFLGVTFENDFGGAGIRYAVGPAVAERPIPVSEAVWRPGHSALFGARKTRGENGREMNGAGHPGSLPISQMMGPLVKLFASPAKHRKYVRDPVQFHEDSRYAVVRWLGRLYS